MAAPLITVIVPVYNVCSYLDRCVQSIIGQTYKNLEILLIDDGSGDESADMCDRWAKKDSRIIVIHKKNGGQAEARNKGLILANGAYIGFVDSDDFISQNMYEHMMMLMLEYSVELVECSKVDCYKESSDIRFPSDEEITVLKSQEIIAGIINDRYFTSTVWNMLIKAEIAKAVKFDEGKIHEDILYPYRVMTKCNKAVSTTRKLYAYYQRPGSTMNTRYTEKRFDALDALQTRAQEIKQAYPNLYPKAERAYAGSCMYHYQSLEREPKCQVYSVYMQKQHERFCSADWKAIMRITGPKYKMWYTLFRFFPKATAHIRNRLGIGL